MSNQLIRIDYDELIVDRNLVGRLEHCNCCGMRELSGFQEDYDSNEHLAENVWDWFEDLDVTRRLELGLSITPNRYGGMEYPPMTQMCARFVELFPDVASEFENKKLNRVCLVLSTIGKEWQPPTAITILTLVENWDNAYPIMDALVEGGWQLSVDTVLNTNSRNDISLWTYRRKETV